MANNIEKEAWRSHFKKLLGKMEFLKEKNNNIAVGNIEEEQEEDGLQEEEMYRAVKKMKLRKACGLGIRIEAWRYAENGLRKELTMLLNQI